MADAKILPLAVVGLGFRVGDISVLDGATFDIAPGSRNIVLGPNGAGKSVMLRLLHGLLTPTSGRVGWSNPDALAVRRAQAPRTFFCAIFNIS